MVFKLNINGDLNFTICELNTKTPLGGSIAFHILDKLQKGKFVIDINNKTILDRAYLSFPLYSFIIESNEQEYFFSED